MPSNGPRDALAGFGYPRATIAIAVAVSVAFGLQLALAPAACASSRYPAVCAELALLREATWLGVLLMPFLHGSWLHLGGNLLALLVLGGGTERLYGRRILLWLFLAGGYLSTELQLVEKLATDQLPVTVGISGAVYGLGAFLAVMLSPTSRSGVVELLDVDSTEPESMVRPPLLAIGLVSIAHALLTHVGVVPIAPRTATLSHLVGAAFGAGTALYLRVAG